MGMWVRNGVAKACFYGPLQFFLAIAAGERVGGWAIPLGALTCSTCLHECPCYGGVSPGVFCSIEEADGRDVRINYWATDTDKDLVGLIHSSPRWGTILEDVIPKLTIGSPPSGFVGYCSRTITYRPNPDLCTEGTDSIFIEACDAELNQDKRQIKIPFEANHSPTIDVFEGIPRPSWLVSEKTVYEVWRRGKAVGLPFALSFKVSDPDGDQLEVDSWAERGSLAGGAPQNCAGECRGTWTYTPPSDLGVRMWVEDGVGVFIDTIHTTVADTCWTSWSEVMVWLSNAVPMAHSQTVDYHGGTVPITLSGEDQDGDPIQFELLTNPSHGTLSGPPLTLPTLPPTQLS